MLYPSERHAEDLLRLLSVAVRPETKLSFDRGTHQCRARNEENACEIVCFDTNGRQGEPGEARYYIVCQRWVDGVRYSTHMTVGHSSSQSEIVATVVCWMEGQTVEAFHERFPFMGRFRRFYAGIEEGILRYGPELADATTRSFNDISLHSGRYEIWFRTPTRSCCISPTRYGDDFSESRCVFYGKGIRVPITLPIRDLNLSAQVMKRWLCDNAMPSQLRVEFPYLTMGPLADSYDAEQLIEGDFLESWEDTEEHYWDFQFASTGETRTASNCAQVLDFIADIRRAGYDKTLRAGVSLLDLVFSRSRHHGLRDDQPRVIFRFPVAGMQAGMRVNFDSKYVANLLRKDRTEPDYALLFPEIKFTPAVAELLSRLEAEEIS